MLRYRVFQTFSFIVQRAPRRVAYSIAWLAGMIAYALNSHARAVSADNVRHALGPAATPARLRRAVRGCFVAAACYYTDLARTPQLDP